jgi:hypothetical protein
LSVIGSTIFYSLGYNRFVDGSTLASAITIGSGTPQVQAFQPFSPAASYRAASYGGSGYFPGSSYLSVADNAALEFGTSSFCIEVLYYPTLLPAAQNIFAKQPNPSTDYGFRILAINGVMTAYISSGNTSDDIVNGATFGTLKLNAWNHISVYRVGTAFYGSVNGTVTTLNASTSLSVWNNTSGWVLGAASTGAGSVTGYFSDWRIVVGSGVYTSSSAPFPTAPLTAITNTALLDSFTNAGIYDAAWQNNALTVGDAQVSTTQAQWPTTSMKFDGTGDYLDILGPNQGFNLSSGNWTIEAWIYRTQTNKLDVILSMFNTINTNSGLSFYVNASNQLVTDNGVTAALAAGTVPSNQWVYVAIVRSGSTTTGYVNGTSVGTTTQAPNAAQYARIGFFGLSSLDPTWAFNGYIQDLRITKGVARTITTPTAAFPTR